MNDYTDGDWFCGDGEKREESCRLCGEVEKRMSEAYDELVKRLREHNGWALNETLDKAADAIEELQSDNAALNGTVSNLIQQIAELSKPHWIPVTEALPNEDGWYQVYAPEYSGGSSSGLKNINGNMYSAFKHGKWSIEVGYHKRPGCVKAWMPLPEPPEPFCQCRQKGFADGDKT